MRYFVIHPSGQRFGPADAATLSQWAAEGRLAPTSLLAEEVSGRQLPAHQVPGIQFPNSQYPNNQYPSNQYQGMPPNGPVQPGYAQPNNGPYAGQGSALGGVPQNPTGGINQPGQYGNPGNPYQTPNVHNSYQNPYQGGADQLNLSYIVSGVGLVIGSCCCGAPMAILGILCGIAGLVAALSAQGKGTRAGGAIFVSILAITLPIAWMILGQILQSSLSR